MRDQKLIVDPGFVHHRKILTLLREPGEELITSSISRISPATPAWQKDVLIDRIYTRSLLEFCSALGVNTLEQLLLEQRGRLFCSIVECKPCPEIYEKPRVTIEAIPRANTDYKVVFELTSSRVTGDTLRAHLSEGGEFAFVAEVFQQVRKRLVLHPLVIGFPYMADAKTEEMSWTKYSDFYNVHIEDFDEFAAAKDLELPDEFKRMRDIKERVFKAALGKILHESTPTDWGGESSDFLTSHLHLQGQRVRAAFLLKGPAKFSPMTISHLGQNGDQIVRLAHEPADVLVVQHCHDITSPVIEMLKVFATQPSNPRRYCLVDGRESLRLLEAFNLTEWAINASTV